MSNIYRLASATGRHPAVYVVLPPGDKRKVFGWRNKFTEDGHLLISMSVSHEPESDLAEREERIKNLVSFLMDEHAPVKLGPCNCAWCKECGELFPHPLQDRPPLPEIANQE